MVKTARFPEKTLSNTGDTENLGEMVVEPGEVQGNPREINGDLGMYRKIWRKYKENRWRWREIRGSTKRSREIFY
jgi:hypothetical protein